MTAILSNSTRKLLWFEITKMLTAIYCNSRHTFVPNTLAGFLVVSVRTILAKFHYTDPTRTRHGPDRPRTDFFCGETPLGPCGSGRVRVVEFSSYPTTCADFVRVRSVSGPCSGI